eukprot:jgi/Tetstr1/440396/TSEL_028730.t1
MELSPFRYEERLGKQRDFDLKSKLMEEPVRSAETASHVETIEALKALATNRDFPIDIRSAEDEEELELIYEENDSAMEVDTT